MTIEAALHKFYNDFSLTAYEENTVPDNAPFPYITYSMATGSLLRSVSLTANLWYRSSSWTACNMKAREIHAVVSTGIMIPCDNGGIWLRADNPFAQNMSDPSDDQIKRKYLRLIADFITN